MSRLLLIFLLLPLLGLAQPVRTIRVVVPFAPGALTDSVARHLQTALNERVSQPVLLVHKPGAGGDIATKYVSAAGSDELMLLLHSPAYAINRAFDPADASRENIVPLVYLGQAPMVLAVPAKSPLAKFEVWQKLDPQTAVTFGSAGVGSMSHLYGEMLKHSLKKNLVHVSYKGLNPVVADLLGRHIDSAFLYASNALPLSAAGDLTIVASVTERRVKFMPQVPTLKELGVRDIDRPAWYVIFGNKNAPAGELLQIQRSLLEILGSNAVAKALSDQGVEVAARSISQDFIAKEVQKYKDIIRVTGITKE